MGRLGRLGVLGMTRLPMLPKPAKRLPCIFRRFWSPVLAIGMDTDGFWPTAHTFTQILAVPLPQQQGLGWQAWAVDRCPSMVCTYTALILPLSSSQLRKNRVHHILKVSLCLEMSDAFHEGGMFVERKSRTVQTGGKLPA